MTDNSPPGEISTRSYRHLFNSSTLGVEIIVIFIVGLTAYGLKVAPPTQIWVTVGVGVILCIIALAVAKSAFGLGFAAVVQVLLILSGLVIPTMWFLGGLFAFIWLLGVFLGHKIDREKKQYVVDHPEEFPELHNP